MDVINKDETFPAFLSRNLCTFNFSRYLRWKFCVKLALEAKPTFVQCPHLHHNSDVESEERQTESGGVVGMHTMLSHCSLTQLTSLFAVEGVALFDGRETSGLHSTKLLNQQSHASAPHRQTWNQLVLSSSYSPLLTLPKLSLCPCQVCLSVQNTTLLTYQENLTLLNIPGKSDIAEIPGKSDIAEYTRKI